MSHASSESTLPPGVKDVRRKVFWVGTLIVLFFAAIMLKAVWPEGTPNRGANGALSVQCHNVSSVVEKSCIVEGRVESTWFKAAEGPKVDGMNLCYSPAEFVTVDSKTEDGTVFMRFRTKNETEGNTKEEMEDKYVVTYKLIDLQGAPKCPSEF